MAFYTRSVFLLANILCILSIFFMYVYPTTHTHTHIQPSIPPSTVDDDSPLPSSEDTNEEEMTTSVLPKIEKYNNEESPAKEVQMDVNYQNWLNYLKKNETNLFWWNYLNHSEQSIPKARTDCQKSPNSRWVVVSFATGERRLKESKKLIESAKEIGVDEVWMYGEDDIDQEWREQNSWVKDHPQGLGCWSWKPYLIWKSLLRLNNGDIAFWIDSDTQFKRNATDYYCLVNDIDVTPFHLDPPSPGKVWTDRQAFMIMDADTKEYTETRLILGGYFFFKKTDKIMKLVSEWMTYAQNKQIVCPLTNLFPNYPEFHRHRHDQSILSILVKKYKLVTFPTPSQWALTEEDKLLRKLSGLGTDLLYHHD